MKLALLRSYYHYLLSISRTLAWPQNLSLSITIAPAATDIDVLLENFKEACRGNR